MIFSDKEIHWLHWSMNFLITIKINVVKWPSLTFIILKDSWLKDAHEMKISASLSFFSSVSDKVLFGISLNIKHSSLTVMFQSCKLYRCFLLVCFFFLISLNFTESWFVIENFTEIWNEQIMEMLTEIWKAERNLQFFICYIPFP